LSKNDPVLTMISYVVGSVALLTVALIVQPCRVVGSGERGVYVSLGKPSDGVVESGLHFVAPWASIRVVDVRQQSQSANATAYAKDNQVISGTINVTYRVGDVRRVVIDTQGDVWEKFLVPKLASAFKNELSRLTASEVLADRAGVEARVLAAFQADAAGLAVVDTLSIANFDFDDRFEAAVQDKFVEQQAAQKAKFTQQKAEADAQAAVTRAKGDAEATEIAARAEAAALKLKAEALRASPGTIELERVKKWDGKYPTVVSGGGLGMMMKMPE